MVKVLVATPNNKAHNNDKLSLNICYTVADRAKLCIESYYEVVRGFPFVETFHVLSTLHFALIPQLVGFSWFETHLILTIYYPESNRCTHTRIGIVISSKRTTINSMFCFKFKINSKPCCCFRIFRVPQQSKEVTMEPNSGTG